MPSPKIGHFKLISKVSGANTGQLRSHADVVVIANRFLMVVPVPIEIIMACP